MRDLPIPFTAPMVMSILRGAKTETRRTSAPRWKVGDRLYVRESWRVSAGWDQTRPSLLPARTMTVMFAAGGSIANQADGLWRPTTWPDGPAPSWAGKLRPPMFMPRWASRLTLIVEEVRRERLHAIDEAGAVREGCVEDWADGDPVWYVPGARLPRHAPTAVGCYSILWDTINGLGSWAADPTVTVTRFTAVVGNVDQLERKAA